MTRNQLQVVVFLAEPIADFQGDAKLTRMCQERAELMYTFGEIYLRRLETVGTTQRGEEVPDRRRLVAEALKVNTFP